MTKRIAAKVSMLALGAIGLSPAAPGAETRKDGGERGARAPHTASAQPRDLAFALQEAYMAVADEVVPAVVGITAFRRRAGSEETSEPRGWREASRRRYPDHRQLASGSGFVVDEEGYILSNQHYLRDPATGELADLIDVELKGDVHVTASVIGIEPTINVAILKVDRSVVAGVATLGNSDYVQMGQSVIAIGDPDGPERTFSAGLIAATPQRDCYQEQLTRTYLQSTVRIHEESFGGPLVDLHGQVVAMNTPRYDSAHVPEIPGSVYALPINLIKTIYEPIRARGSMRSPWLGISVLEIEPVLRESIAAAWGRAPELGILIDDVFVPSPASEHDIRIGDVLVSMNGKDIPSVPTFQMHLYRLGDGRKVTLGLFRDGEVITKDVAIEERPASATTH